jgi:cyclopropane-fatty-acyl-phospholipid synthase
MYRILLKKGTKQGCLVLKFSNGETERFGSGGTEIVWLLKNRRTIWRILSNWEYQLGETYINGEWEVEGGTIVELWSLLRTNFKMPSTLWATRLSALLLMLDQGRNNIRLSKSNVGHHYDLDTFLFESFLDTEMNYSCAYFESADLRLERAQQAKCAYVCKKLMLDPGQSVLDIGCGWGSMALYTWQSTIGSE